MCAVSEVAGISGEKVFHIYVEREVRKITAETVGICRGCSMYLRGIRDVESVFGGNYTIDELGIKITMDGSNSIEVILR
jgi:hypothetical protein